MDGCSFEIEELTYLNKKQFEKIKFWDFIQTEDFIDNPNQSVLLLKINDEYVAYVAEEHELCRKIHGLGQFNLSMSEGWIGPAYVVKKWRGRGVNKLLIGAQMKSLKEKGIRTFYTSINSSNIASLKSFSNIGFSVIGKINNEGKIVCDSKGILYDAFEKIDNKY